MKNRNRRLTEVLTRFRYSVYNNLTQDHKQVILCLFILKKQVEKQPAYDRSE